MSARRRERLVGPASFVIMASAVVVLLVLLFPKAKDKSRTGRPSLAELELDVDEQPKESAPRLALVREMSELGHLDRAWEALQPLLEEEEPSPAAQRLALEINHARWVNLPTRSRERRKLEGWLSTSLEEMADKAADEKLPEEDMEVVAKLALETGRTEMAADLYTHLAERQPEKREHWSSEAGRWYLASGKTEDAALSYTGAARAAKTPKEALPYWKRVIEVQRAGNKNQAAVELAESLLGRFSRDPVLLDHAVDASQASGDPKRASRWMARRLELSPDDPDVLRRALAVALAAGDLQAARLSAERLLERNPGDGSVRKQLAQILEWVGDPAVALVHWIALARRGDQEAMARAHELSRQLYDFQALITLLRMKSFSAPLTAEETLELATALEDIGNPEEAEQLLVTFVRRTPDWRPAWERIARLREWTGDLRGSLEAMATIRQRFGVRLVDVIREAKLAFRLRDQPLAFERLRLGMALAGPGDIEYWELLSTLGWNLEQWSDSRLGYQRLWEADAYEEPDTAIRLLELTRRAGDIAETVRLGAEGFERYRNPRMLLEACDAAAQSGRWTDVEHLLGMGARNEGLLKDFTAYWLLRAGLARQQGRLDDAMRNLEMALAVEPRRGEARSGLLDLALLQDDRDRLSSLLDLWLPDAEGQPDDWGSLSEALLRLGRTKEALVWGERNARARPNERDALMAYAESLRRAGRPSSAARLKRYVMASYRERAVRAAREERPDLATEFVLEAALLAQEMEGVEAGQRLMAPLLSRAGEDPAVQEAAIAWYLERDQPGRARYWMERQRAAGREPKRENRVEVALAEGDRRDLARAVGASPEGLSLLDRIEVERSLGRHDAAYELVTRALASGKASPEEVEILNEHESELRSRRETRLEAGWRTESQGFLETRRLHGGVSVGHGDWRVGVEAGRATHEAPRDVVYTENFGAEVDAGGALTYTTLRTETTVGAGVSARDDADVLRLRLDQSYAVSRRLDTRLELRLNGEPDDTPILRLLGVRDSAHGVVSLEFSSREYATARVGWLRHHTREGEYLGNGVEGELGIGHRLCSGNPQCEISLVGDIVINSLEDELPAKIGDRLEPGSSIDDVVPRRFASLGPSLMLGEKTPGRAFRLRLWTELWMGWLWFPRPSSGQPAGSTHSLGYFIEGGLGLGVFSGELGTRAFYGNFAGASADERHLGIAIQYSQRI